MLNKTKTAVISKVSKKKNTICLRHDALQVLLID